MIRSGLVRLAALALLAASCAALALPTAAHTVPINLATMSCNKYENEVLPDAGSESSSSAKSVDAINTVMWLFGFSVGKAGDHVMYGDALTSFGFALDAACKNEPGMSLLEALAQVTPRHDKPMNLDTLTCALFESRHAESRTSDPESAATIMMWLFGFSVGRSGSHFFDAGEVGSFENSLGAECAQHPDESVFDALGATSKRLSHR